MDLPPNGPGLAAPGCFSKLLSSANAQLAQLPWRRERIPGRRLLVREGDPAVDCLILAKGYAFRSKATRDGARQIVSLHLAGDLLSPHPRTSRSEHSIEAATMVEVLRAPAQAIRDLTLCDAATGDAISLELQQQTAILSEWLVNLGRRDAHARIAHLLCEFAWRRWEVGLGSLERFAFPFNQEQLADATGLSVVHVNRTLQLLIREGIIARDGREIVVPDWERLTQVADFDARYLQVASESPDVRR